MYLPELKNIEIPPLSTMRPQAPQTSFFVKRGNQSAWGPGVISNVFFGTLMVFMGVATLWQGYYFWKINHARGKGSRDYHLTPGGLR
jgi:hypothetical protein